MIANIWGGEVKACIMCKYWHDDCCRKLDRWFYTESEDGDFDETLIHSDCLFIQPITKNTFEELGFRLVKEDSEFQYYQKQLDDNNWYEIQYSDDEVIIEKWQDVSCNLSNCNTVFHGKIHNPEHLKFILSIIL